MPHCGESSRRCVPKVFGVPFVPNDSVRIAIKVQFALNIPADRTVPGGELVTLDPTRSSANRHPPEGQP